MSSPLPWIVVGALAVGLAFYPPFCDGALSVNDGVFYGMLAEQDPPRSVIPHHPLFHALVLLVMPVARAFEDDHPGHLATRIVSGLGAAAALILIAAFAGRRRLGLGAWFALVFFASRIFWVETAAGENLLPAAAGALALAFAVTRAEPRVPAVLGALTLALLLRQDSILLIPGVVLALLHAWPRAVRWGRISAVLAGALTLTVSGYLAAWLLTGSDVNFLGWLTRYESMSWIVKRPFDPEWFWFHAATLGGAAFGRQWASAGPHVLPGLLCCLLPVVCGFPQLRSRAFRSLAWFIAAAIPMRFVFYSLFEPVNPEWHVFTLALFAALGASTLDGVEPARPGIRLRVLGLALISALILGSHLPWTWRLRQSTIVDATRAAVARATGEPHGFAASDQVGTAFTLLKVPWQYLPEPLPDQVTAISGVLRTPGRSAIVVADREIGDGMPHTLRNPPEHLAYIDAVPPIHNLISLSRNGHVYAFVVQPGFDSASPTVQTR